MITHVTRSRRQVALMGAAAIVLGTGLTGCSGSPATVDFAQTAGSLDAVPTVTITDEVTTTVTTTATETVPVTTTATATQTVTSTVTPPPPTYVPLSPNTPPLPSVRTELDRSLADGAARAVIADVAAIDQLFGGGGAADVSVRLNLLDGNLATLLSAGTMPQVDGPSYTGRILSLRVFTAAAAREAPEHRVAARNRWDVIRPEIATLLAQVTLGLGTTYALPTVKP